MNLNNHDKLLELDTAIREWEHEESGRTLDFREHLKEGLYEQAESIKCIIEAFDLKETALCRARMEEVFAEAWVALYFVKKKYSINMSSDSFQTLIDEHCEFLTKQYEVEKPVEVDYSTMEF